MRKNNVVALKKPDTFIDDPLTDLLRQGARTLKPQAVKTELEVFLSLYDFDCQNRKSFGCSLNLYFLMTLLMLMEPSYLFSFGEVLHYLMGLATAWLGSRGDLSAVNYNRMFFYYFR
jgi:hypothetical protein